MLRWLRGFALPRMVWRLGRGRDGDDDACGLRALREPPRDDRDENLDDMRPRLIRVHADRGVGDGHDGDADCCEQRGKDLRMQLHGRYPLCFDEPPSGSEDRRCGKYLGCTRF